MKPVSPPSPDPFRTLVRHFVRRIFASEDEQGSSSVGLGLGAVLAILASPGAFASIFLLDKYSTLLQWLRHLRIDPIRASVSDEYFFVVLSMTITGLVMVLRWNRLLPDRRDFANLAILPIPIRNVFLANFVALFGLALLFAFDVNAVSMFLFPLFVNLSDGTTAAFLAVGVSHIVTVLLASLFSFFAVFALVGLMMLLVPKRIFGAVSILVRVVLVISLLTEFLSNLFLQLFAGRLPGHAGNYAHFLPSFWFLGIYERILGIAKPEMAELGREALLALAAAIVIAIVAYMLCYRRYFLRLAETLETIGSGHHAFRLPLPEWLAGRLFRSPFEWACSSLALKVLLRSEQHLMFFGAYLGIGLVMVAQTTVDAMAGGADPTVPKAGYLAIPLMIAFFIVSGLRFVFDIPAALNANWVFRITVEEPKPEPRRIAFRFMLLAVLPLEIAVLLPVTTHLFGWKTALAHTATVTALTVLFANTMLVRFRKIPFTCSTQPEVKRFLIRIIGSLFAVLLIVPMLAEIERWMLINPIRFAGFALALAGCWYWLHRYRREMLPNEKALTYEDGPAPAFEFLKLA
jgi:hypothetical protein